MNNPQIENVLNNVDEKCIAATVCFPEVKPSHSFSKVLAFECHVLKRLVDYILLVWFWLTTFLGWWLLFYPLPSQKGENYDDQWKIMLFVVLSTLPSLAMLICALGAVVSSKGKVLSHPWMGATFLFFASMALGIAGLFLAVSPPPDASELGFALVAAVVSFPMSLGVIFPYGLVLLFSHLTYRHISSHGEISLKRFVLYLLGSSAAYLFAMIVGVILPNLT